MDIEATIARVKELSSQREAIDRELAEIFGGQAPARRAAPVCSKCHQPGHRANTCTATTE